MPTIWTKCPNCLRPIETDAETDGSEVLCPGCDAVVPVPKPVVFRVPSLVWLALVLMVSLPCSLVPGFFYYYDSWRMNGPLLFFSVVMLLPGYFLVQGRYPIWLAVLVGSILAVFGAITLTMMGIAMYFFAPIGEFFLVIGLPVLLLSAALLAVLLTPTLRQWCHQ